MSRLTRASLVATVVLAVASSCSPAPPSGSTGSRGATPATSSSAAASAAAPSATSSSAPAATAPPELQGSWQATISTGEDVTLELRASGYTVDRAGAVGSGAIDVESDLIVFSSARCELGTGTYQWSIDDGTLTFTPIEPIDPCGNRLIFLQDAAYTRVD